MSTISSIGLPPSDQLECEWQSPLSWAKRSAPPLASGFALPCNDSRYAGQLTVQGLAHHRGGGLPDARQVLQGAGLVTAAELVLRRLPDGDDGLAERLDPVGAGPLTLQEEGDAPQRLVGLDGGDQGFDGGDHGVESRTAPPADQEVRRPWRQLALELLAHHEVPDPVAAEGARGDERPGRGRHDVARLAGGATRWP